MSLEPLYTVSIYIRRHVFFYLQQVHDIFPAWSSCCCGNLRIFLNCFGFLFSFQGPVQELMQFTSALDTPSIHVQKETLLTRYSVDAMLYELMNLVKSICPDLNSRIYRAVPR